MNANAFDSEEFDHICYAYRAAPSHKPEQVAAAFEAVCAFGREALRELLDAVIAMHKADMAYGCGFYNNGDWCEAYERTWEIAKRHDDSLSSKTDTDRASHG